MTNNEISVLEKGLTFIPSIKVFHKDVYLEELNRQTTKLMLLDYFGPDDQINNRRFEGPNTWKPPWRRITPETQKCINEMNDVTNEILNSYSIDQDLVKIWDQHNLTLGEREAL